ncbi:Protocadherin Fat 1 [Armadillidium vulgare]|nr:Protocadherin Fat 1 [Armadillidium vulgare]
MGSDFEVERVQSPYVKKEMWGPLMQSESNSQHMSMQSTSPFRSYSTYDRPNRGCLSCQHGIVGKPSGGSSSSYSSFSSYGGGMRSNPVYTSPRQSLSRHEFRKEQEFVNGQQVYDLHHEKKYKDGQLIDESRHEKVPEDFGVSNQVDRAQSSSLYNPQVSAYGSSNSFSESQRGSNYNILPQSSYQTRQYHESQNSGIGSDHHDFDDDHFDDEFEREMERLQEELRRQTLTSAHVPIISSPTYGGSHRSEFRKETRYVNGKPVYMINEEKKYKDGKLIHNVRDEKGPEDLGTTGVLPSSPILTSPTGRAFSSHHQEVYNNRQSQIPVSGPSYHPSYPSSPRNTNERIYNPSYSSSSETSSSTYHQQPHYRPSSVYTSQTVEEQKETQTRRNYYPTYDRSNENEIEGFDKTYPHSNRRGPPVDTYYRPETTTPSTSTIAGPLYDSRPNYNKQPASQHRYEEQTSNTQYSHNLPASAPVTYKYDRNYEKTYGSEEKIKEASQSSYYDLKSRQTYGEDRDRRRYQQPSDRAEVVDQDEDDSPSYNTGVFSTYSQSQETETSHTSPSRTSVVADSSRSYRPGTHTTSTSQEEYSRRVSSHHYPSRDQRPEDSSSPDLNIPGVIRGPSDYHATSKENEIEDERYDVSPYDGVSDTEPDEDSTPRTVQYEKNPTSPHEYGPRRYPEPDRYTGQSQGGYSVYNSSRVDHIRKVLPSRWVETKSTWKYHNGKLVSETKHYRYYENGILIHENSTRKTRDELRADGIDVNALDLTSSQLIEYGPAVSSQSHSQKHEMHQIKRFKNGQQIYELNHERRFQDGSLVHDKREEKDEDDFLDALPYTSDAYNAQRQDISRHSTTGVHSNTGIQTIAVNPQTVSRKHEVRQEEEFVNGQKVYDFHHEREYHDGKLIREDKTELGPDDLGAHRVEHRDALKELVSGRTHSSVAHNSLIEQQRTADNLLRTSCVTCGSVHGSAAHSQGSILSSLGLPPGHGVKAGSTFRQDVNIEEHYKDGELVKGKEEKKKWLDGQLVDAKEEHYYDGPSRANISTDLSSGGFSSSAALSAFSAAPVGTVHKSTSGSCSSNPCRNKGTCKESLRGPVCVCEFGFKGTYCEEAYCPSRYCRYGGSCSISNDEHICSCHEGYSGYRCSTRLHKVRIGATAGSS